MTDKKLTGRGGAGRGQGRKPGQTSRKSTRTVVKQIRWTEEEWQQVTERAQGSGIAPSRYIRKKALE